MRSVKRCMPPKADSRVAFLVIHYRFPHQFKNTNSRTVRKTIAAVSFGFFAMLRFHSYNKLCLESLRLVLKGGREVTPSKVGLQITVNLLTSNSIFGFYFIFDDKFHPGARAYFCKVGDLHHSLRRLCPLSHLEKTVELSQNSMFFPKSEITSGVLTKTMETMARVKKNVKPHSLRIGGHTYYTVYGLNPEFRDYLARRKVNKPTQTYYRASPYLTIYKLRQFFLRTFKQ